MRDTKRWAAGLAIGLLLVSAIPLLAQRGRPAVRPPPRPPVVHPPGGSATKPLQSHRPGSESLRPGTRPDRPLGPFLLGPTPEPRELKGQVAGELKAAEEQGREPRKAEFERGIFVFLGESFSRDGLVMREAERFREDLKKRALITEQVHFVTLLRDNSSRRAIKQAFAGLSVTLLNSVHEKKVLNAIASSPNGLVVLIGHHEKGRMNFPGEAAEHGLDIANLTSEAAKHGTMVLPIGCGTGLAAPLGIAATRINSVEVVHALGSAIRASSNVWSFLTTFAGTHELTLNIATFEVPAVFEVRAEGQKEPWATVVLPPVQSRPGPPTEPCLPLLDPECKLAWEASSLRLPERDPPKPAPSLLPDPLDRDPKTCPPDDSNCSDIDRQHREGFPPEGRGLPLLAAAIFATLSLVQWRKGKRGKAVFWGFGALAAGLSPSFVLVGLLSCAGLVLFFVALFLVPGTLITILEGSAPARDE